MTSHYYPYPKGVLHFYEMGYGKRFLLCFHGFGMHGKQFKDLEWTLGKSYTLISFDLFFHQETKLHDQSLRSIQKGLSKQEFSQIILDFCHFRGINRFSVLGYSIGTHYATVLAEEIPYLMDHYIVVAPASLHPSFLVRFLGITPLGNYLLKSIILHKKALPYLLKSLKNLGAIDHKAYSILYEEVKTTKLRLYLYANFVYLNFLILMKIVYYLHWKTIKSKPISILENSIEIIQEKLGIDFLKK